MPRVKLFNEEETLDKAMDLFWKKGYHATSVQDLVDHLGINRASLYSTYGGKKELYDKAFGKYRKINSGGVAAFLYNQSDVRQGLRTLFEKAIDESIADSDKKGCFVVNATTELIPGDDKIRASLQENKKVVEGIFYKFLLSGQERGEFKKDKDIQTIAGLLFTLYSGLKVVAKIESNRKKLMANVDMVLGVLD